MISLSGTGVLLQGATITVGDQPASLLLHLGRGRSVVRGTATLDGKAVVGAMVLLVPATLGAVDNLLQTVRAETNTDGSYALREVVPGKYILLAIAHGWDVQWQSTAALLPYLTHVCPSTSRVTPVFSGISRQTIPERFSSVAPISRP